MRTHKPIDLAKKILEYDSIPRRRNDILPDSLDSLLARAQNYEIRLIDRIPIYIIYQTVTVDRNGMIVHIDIYDRDKKFIKTIMQSWVKRANFEEKSIYVCNCISFHAFVWFR